jgi:hypothetical protein
MSPAIMRDAAVSVASKEEHLVFKRVRAQRPGVAEHYGLPGPPVVVEELRAVFGSDCAHGLFFYCVC